MSNKPWEEFQQTSDVGHRHLSQSSARDRGTKFGSVSVKPRPNHGGPWFWSPDSPPSVFVSQCVEMTPVPPAYYAHSTWSRTEEQRNIEACGNVVKWLKSLCPGRSLWEYPGKYPGRSLWEYDGSMYSILHTPYSVCMGVHWEWRVTSVFGQSPQFHLCFFEMFLVWLW